MEKKIKYFLIGILVVVVVITIALTILVWPPVWFLNLRGPSVSSDAKAKSSMAQIQAKTESIMIKDKSYDSLTCNYDDIMKRFCDDIEKRVGMKPTIYAIKDKYCAYIKLNVKGYYCIDSKGVRRETDIDPSGLGYCDGKTFVCPPD